MFAHVARYFSLHLRPELKELYIFSFFFSLAQALIVIFEPVFFYQQGFSLAMILIYYAVHYTLYTVLLPWGGKFVARFGLEHSLALSTPIFVAYFLVLALLPFSPLLCFWVAALLLTVHKIFYWPAYYTTFARFGESGNRGTELSWIHLFLHGVGIVGPLLGGLVVTWYGFSVLFVITAGVVLLSSVALLRTREVYRVTQFAYSAPWRIIFEPRQRRISLATLGMGENLIQLVLWPIFMFIVLGTAAELGLVAALTGVAMTIFGFVAGELSDRWSPRRVLRIVLPFFSLSKLFLPLATTPWRVLLTNMFTHMGYNGVSIPFFSHLYTESNRSRPLAHLMAFEIVLSLAKAITAWLLVVVFLWFVPYTAFTLAFWLAALLTWFYFIL
jgi:MFS family permease